MKWRKKSEPTVEAMRLPRFEVLTPHDGGESYQAAMAEFVAWLDKRGAVWDRKSYEREPMARDGHAIRIFNVGSPILVRPGDYAVQRADRTWHAAPAEVFEEEHIPGPAVTWDPLDIAGRLAKRGVLEDLDAGLRVCADVEDLAEAMHDASGGDADIERAVLNLCVAAQALMYVFVPSPTARERNELRADAARRNAFWTSGVETGRFSSRGEPNLENIPRER